MNDPEFLSIIDKHIAFPYEEDQSPPVLEIEYESNGYLHFHQYELKQNSQNNLRLHQKSPIKGLINSNTHIQRYLELN